MMRDIVCLKCKASYIISSQSAQPCCPFCGLKALCIKCGEPYAGQSGICSVCAGKALGLVVDIAQQPHYTQWKIQPITFISANQLNFCQGNVIKYVMRYKAKNGLEDLKKAKVYIDYLIQELETGEVKP